MLCAIATEGIFLYKISNKDLFKAARQEHLGSKLNVTIDHVLVFLARNFNIQERIHYDSKSHRIRYSFVLFKC